MARKESPESADQRIRLLRSGVHLGGENPQPVNPYVAPGPDGKLYLLPQVHVATIDPQRVGELVEMIAARTAFMLLCVEHGPEKSAELLDAARHASQEYGARKQREAAEAAAAAQESGEAEMPQNDEAYAKA